MLNIFVHNYDNPSDYKGISGALIYLDSGVDVPNVVWVPTPRKLFKCSNAKAKISFKNVPVGDHEIWIIPDQIYTGVVGPGFNPDKKIKRVHRPIKVDFEIELDAVTGKKKLKSCSTPTQQFGKVKLKTEKEHFGGQPFIDARVRCVFIESPNKVTPQPKFESIIIHRTDDPRATPAGLSPTINAVLKTDGSSVHYIVGRDGHVCKALRDSERGVHAQSRKGKGSYWGKTWNLNGNSIGIENVALSSKHAKVSEQELTSTQYDALIKLLLELCDKHKIDRHKILGHGDIRVKTNKVLGGWRDFCPGADNTDDSLIVANPLKVSANKFDWKKLAGFDLGLKCDFAAAYPTSAVELFFDHITGLGLPALKLKRGDRDPAPLTVCRFDGKDCSVFDAIEPTEIEGSRWYCIPYSQDSGMVGENWILVWKS